MIKQEISNLIAVKQSLDLSRYLYALYKLKFITNELIDIVKEFERYVIAKKTYTYDEDNVIRGSIVWSRALAAIPLHGSIPQIVIVRSVNTPENLALKLLLLYMKLKITSFYRKLCKCVDEIGKKLSFELSNPIDVIGLMKLDPIHIKNRFVDETIQKIDKAIKNTILFHVKYASMLIEFKDFEKMSTRDFDEICKKIEKELKKLIRIIESDAAKKWRPRWVSRLVELYEVVNRFLQELDNIVTVIEHVRGLEPKELLAEIKMYVRFMAWKLYELYILFLLLKALVNLLRSRNINFDDRKVIIQYDDRRKLLTIYWGKPLDTSNISLIKTLDNKIIDSDMIKRIRGRPDISIEIQNKVSIVLEAKFTKNPSYLTQSRFKVMAYMYEYGVDMGILAFPGISRNKQLDEEEAETFQLMKKAENADGVVIQLSNGSKLYLLPIIPLKKNLQRNIQTMEMILKNLITSYIQ